MATTSEQLPDLNRATVIAAIRSNLYARSKMQWSVSGGRGTVYGWITIAAPRARRETPYDTMSKSDCLKLQALLGLRAPVYPSGVSIPAGHDYYREYVDRSAMGMSDHAGSVYWD